MLEGFDHTEITSQTLAIAMQQKWQNDFAASGSLAFSSSVTPFPNRGNSCQFTDGKDHIRYRFSDNLNNITSMASGIVGFHFHYTQTTSDFKFFAGQRGDNETQWSLRLSTNGQLQLYRGNSLLEETNQAVIQENTWYFIEVQYYTADSIIGNSFTVRVDNTEVLNLAAGTDTKTLSTDAVQALFWQGTDGGGLVYIDDIYLLSTTGNHAWNQSRWLGPSYVQTLHPNTDGSAANNFTGSDEDQIDNYLQIDDVISDEDTTFNKHPKSDGVDYYNHAEIGGTNGKIDSIYGTQLTTRAKTNDAAGNLLWQNSFRVSGSQYDFPTTALNNTDYAFFTDLTEVNPGDNQPWDTGVLNRAEFGVHISFV